MVSAVGLARWDALLGVAGAQPSTCSLLPQQTSGPFYFDAKQVRRDIAEGRPGIPLKLALQVVDATSCSPVPGALVDVWHTDAAGIYSGYSGQGDTRQVDAAGEDFMRGIQIADQDGRAEFTTIYPGWYPGRAPHIHFKVLLDRETAVTSQLYFPTATSISVYAEPPYDGRSGTLTTNENDILGRNRDLPALLMTVDKEDDGYRAQRVLGIAGGETATTPTSWAQVKDALL